MKTGNLRLRVDSSYKESATSVGNLGITEATLIRVKNSRMMSTNQSRNQLPFLCWWNSVPYFPGPDNLSKCSTSLENLEHCIAANRLWMTINLLELSCDKTFYYVLSQEALVTVVHAFVTSGRLLQFLVIWHLNSINHLRRTQNSAVHLSASKYDHFTPMLKNLHWLAARQRISFKPLLTACEYKSYQRQSTIKTDI